MGLSSNTLWHQTKIDGLRGIIKKRVFRLSYSLEKLKSNTPYTFSYAFPMISLSDIPFAEFEAFLNKYGGFSIGMKREWILRNDFSPVCYYSNNSVVLRDIIERIEFYKSIFNTLDDSQKRDLNILFSQLAYSKNYEGPLTTSHKVYKSYRFSDEREWRYVPPKGSNIELQIEESVYLQNKSVIQSKANKIILPFSFSDINYIIVNDESQLIEIRKMIEGLMSTPNFLGVVDEPDNVNIGYFTAKQVVSDIFGIAHDIEI
jgi:hypothetical protein